jgi:hypothetical protein
MKLMPLTIAATLSIGAAGAVAMADIPERLEGAERPRQDHTLGPAWPNSGIAERELVGGDDAWPENMFVEHANGKWTVWVLASPAHGQTKALDFFSGRVENVTVQNPGDYADAFVDSHGIEHKGTFHPVFNFKGPKPGGAIGKVHVNVSSLKFDRDIACAPDIEVSERLSDDFQSSIWRKAILYPDPYASNCPSVPWGSLIGTGLELRDGTMLVTAGNYVFRVSAEDLTPVGDAPNLHVVDEAGIKRVIESAKGKDIKDGNAYLTEKLGLRTVGDTKNTKDR